MPPTDVSLGPETFPVSVWEGDVGIVCDDGKPLNFPAEGQRCEMATRRACPAARLLLGAALSLARISACLKGGPARGEITS
jgi:hypothetical protein